jgi:hypothetical protein
MNGGRCEVDQESATGKGTSALDPCGQRLDAFAARERKFDVFEGLSKNELARLEREASSDGEVDRIAVLGEELGNAALAKIVGERARLGPRDSLTKSKVDGSRVVWCFRLLDGRSPRSRFGTNDKASLVESPLDPAIGKDQDRAS